MGYNIVICMVYVPKRSQTIKSMLSSFEHGKFLQWAFNGEHMK